MTARSTPPHSIDWESPIKKEAQKSEGVKLLQELKAMSNAMAEEAGLLNHAQAALILNVSTRRVGELVDLGKLRRFDFLGRTYVSVREIMERRQSDVKGGRPPRTGMKKVVAVAKLIAKHDPVQLAVDIATPQALKKREALGKKSQK